jgi:metal-dependent amidase/aminoacylase/carboxypeptidase family protein
MFSVFSVIVFCLFLTSAYLVFAQEEVVYNTQQGETASNLRQEEAISDANWKQELTFDKQQIQAQMQEVSQNVQAAKVEEAQLKEQIKAATDSGDLETVQQLREQLRSVHQENLQEMKQDKQEIQAAKQEFKNNVKKARQAGYLHFKSGQDNNSSGPKGGSGVSPNRRVIR